jgi:hypothetical protein
MIARIHNNRATDEVNAKQEKEKVALDEACFIGVFRKKQKGQFYWCL